MTATTDARDLAARYIAAWNEGDPDGRRATTWETIIVSTRMLTLAASLTLLFCGAALAQPTVGPDADQAAAYSVASSAVGHWLYDPQGNTVGSVRSLTDDGRTAVIMVGSYFQPGSHQPVVPASALSVVNGKLTLRTETVQALNAVSR